MTRRGKSKTLDCWLAKLKDVQKAPKLSHEHSEYRWMTKNEITSVLDYPEVTELINNFSFKDISD